MRITSLCMDQGSDILVRLNESIYGPQTEHTVFLRSNVVATIFFRCLF